MRVKIRKIRQKEEEQVIIECVEITKEIRDIHSYVLSKGTELSGLSDGKMYKFNLEDVCYFEAVLERLFAYTKDQVYEIKMRLYEVEDTYKSYHFIRCSKSMVMNLMQLDSISPALNGRFMAHMKNGEKIMISRQYVPFIKAQVFGSGENVDE